jgi:hypothetical protein
VVIALLLTGGAATGWGLRPATQRIIRIEHNILDVMKKRPMVATARAPKFVNVNVLRKA